MSNVKKGHFGENIAVFFLKLKGYRIIKRNYRISGGEIDIIAKKKNILAIIEVKTRKDRSYGDPKDAVNYFKKKNIIFATKCFLKSGIYDDLRVRFDVVEIVLKELKINHIKDAFIIADTEG